MADQTSDKAQILRETLSEAPEQLLLPTTELQESAKQSVKFYLDPVAKEYSKVFKDGIFINGLDSLQIWEQARLVLETVADKVLYENYVSVTGEESEEEDDGLEKLAKRRKLAAPEDNSEDDENEEVESDSIESESGAETDEEDEIEVDSEIGSEEEDDDDDELGNDELSHPLVDDIASEDEDGERSDVDQNEDEVDESEDEVDDLDGFVVGDDEIEEDQSEGDEDDENQIDIEEEELDEKEENDDDIILAESPVKDVHGLNDQFFDIDEFNRFTEDAEHNGAFGEDEDDDDDEIDFFADPDEIESGTLKPSRGRHAGNENEEDSDSDDYDEDDLENHDFGGNGGGGSGGLNDNANDVRYEDFFAPPKGSKRGKKGKNYFKKNGEKKSFQGLDNNTNEEDLETAMGSLKKDLFDDAGESEDEEADENGQKLSNHEKMQRKLQAQIAELEEANVAKKNWTLMGEAKAMNRPLNSILEEDLEFDRGAKPVPVITKEVTETLEELIRKRIQNYDFDDLPRRNPDSITPFKRSKLVDVDENKSSKSLAQIYEEEHLRSVDAENNPTEEDSRLKEAHKEIEDLFNSITHKLDALSSWHFVPKPAKPSISIVANAAAISMEDAQPVTMSTESRLAPQEVYVPLNGKSKDSNEVLTGDGLPASRDELTRDERKRRRRREKAKHAKREAKRLEDRKVRAQKDGSRASVIETLKKGNVTVIGKGGEKRDVDGRLKA
ncbi:Mpp10 protein-domain-containing protein [Lipomyces japonicus]|uniref:Mpp10 protein-domain-containing protein n=1 Tax=Lipomyces japonicus TaxID=56871 RepID=UPI0034CE755C